MKAVLGPRPEMVPLPGAVWALGLTSLFMDFPSEMIHGLLPVFLVVNLGVSAAVLGLVEGIAEATAQITRVFSGWLSDLLNRRKALTVVGYGLAAATKPLFPLATSVGTVSIARFADRVGKGIRGAPRGQQAGSPAAKGWRPTPPSRDCAASASLLVCCRRGDGIYARTLQRGISHHPRAASGLAVAWAPAVIAVMSLVFAASAYPAGRLQDKIGARPLLILGLVALIAADLLLGFGQSLVVLFIGIGLWGLHMGLTQGVLSALVAAMAPEHLRGTAFGVFGLITGLAALGASVLAGTLCDVIGPAATFAAGAGFTVLALVGFLVVGSRRKIAAEP
jgi:MFS family permease